jgi:predicted MFS family arabinose efflux permease
MKHLHIRIPKDIFALLTNRVLFRLGFGLVGVFLPIFFYELFDKSLYTLLLIYIILYSITVLLIPLSAKLINTLGIRKSIMLSTPFAAIAIGALYFAQSSPLLATAAFVLSIVLYRVLYWVPYQTDLSHFIGHKDLGAQMAFYKNAIQLMNAITPLIGGFLIVESGFSHVFLFGGVVLFATLIPTYFIEEVDEKYSWGFIETFKNLFAHKNRALLYAYMADGAQSVVSAVVWPVFIFELLDGDYLSVGFITSLTVIVIIVLNTAVGKFIDHVGEEKALTYSYILAATGWVVKVFVDGAFQIFVIDTYHRLGRAANRMSFDSATYEHAADNGHYVDEFTALKELALNLGRVLMLIVVAGLLYQFGNIRAVFLLAAGATLLMVMLNKQLDVK